MLKFEFSTLFLPSADNDQSVVGIVVEKVTQDYPKRENCIITATASGMTPLAVAVVIVCYKSKDYYLVMPFQVRYQFCMLPRSFWISPCTVAALALPRRA